MILDDVLKNNCNALNYAAVVSLFSYGFLEKQTLCVCDLSNSKLFNHLLRAIEVEPASLTMRVYTSSHESYFLHIF